MSVAADCRRPSPHCATAEAPDRSASAMAGKRRTKLWSWARSALRTMAPMRTLPSARSSIRSRPGRCVMSTSRAVPSRRPSSDRRGWCRPRDRRRRVLPGRRGRTNRRRPEVIEGSHATSLRLAASSALVRPAPLRRSPDRRRSGRDCRSWPRAPAPDRRRLGPLWIRPIALMIWPGVQNPHCKPSWAINASCTGWRQGRPARRLSMVRISAPSWLIASARQESTPWRPATITAGAALAAVTALLVPVKCSSSRSRSRSVTRGSSSAMVRVTPLMVSVVDRLMQCSIRAMRVPKSVHRRNSATVNIPANPPSDLGSDLWRH